MENWKPISKINYSQFYELSDKGILRKISNKIILKTHLRNGYHAVNLYNPETQNKNTVNIHRLVALTFLEKVEGKNIVNHINGNKLDNRVENLEWATSKENSEHAVSTGIQKGHPKKVAQYSLEGEFIKSFNSIIEASLETGANDRRISDVCKGKRKTSGGFIWKYEIPEDIINDCEGKIIDEFPNYKITKDGKVYSARAKKFLIPKILKSGYMCVKLCNKGVYKDLYIKKLVREYYPQNISVPNLSEKSDGGSGENSEVRE